jgi:hypothetical protein
MVFFFFVVVVIVHIRRKLIARWRYDITVVA